MFSLALHLRTNNTLAARLLQAKSLYKPRSLKGGLKLDFGTYVQNGWRGGAYLRCVAFPGEKGAGAQVPKQLTPCISILPHSVFRKELVVSCKPGEEGDPCASY